MKQLRIFLSIGGRATENDTSNIWVKNLYDPLIALGHDVYLLNIDSYFTSFDRTAGKENLSNELPEIFKKEHERKPFDLFLSYLHEKQIYPSALQEIKKHVFTVNYSTNYHQFDIYKEVAKVVDHNIYISKIAKEGFDDIGVQSSWMPLAANSTFYKPAATKNNHAVFVGAAYGPRAYLFWRLLQYGIDLHLYGPGWGVSHKKELAKGSIKETINKTIVKSTGYELRKPVSYEVGEEKIRRLNDELSHAILDIISRDYKSNVHGSLSDVEYVSALGEAGAVVNIQESRFNHDFYNHRVLFGSNLRDFETTMCGSFLCTQYSNEIEELFAIGKEIVCYHNEHDLAEKLKYYSANPSHKKQIAEAGYQRAVNSHTWEKRFLDFFSIIGMDK